MTGYVVRRPDGKFFIGCGYGGRGNPVPYWSEDLTAAKCYKTPEGAADAANRFGGYAGKAEADGRGNPAEWFGFLVRWRDEWITVNRDPRDFDPQDYEMNNGPLKSDDVDGFQEDRNDGTGDG